MPSARHAELDGAEPDGAEQRAYARRRATALTCAVACGLAFSHAAAADSRYDDCRAEARQVSGWDGEERQSTLKGALKGGLGGAAVGAAGGWVVGSDAGRAAKRGAKLGAAIGAVKTASENKQLEQKRRTYERALDACMARD